MMTCMIDYVFGFKKERYCDMWLIYKSNMELDPLDDSHILDNMLVSHIH
jgi:hypothetical protein